MLLGRDVGIPLGKDVGDIDGELLGPVGSFVG